MDRIIAVVGIMLIMGGLGALGVWWVQGTKKAMKRRDPRILQARAMAFRRAVGGAVVCLLLVAAFVGVAWVYNNGGALTR
ncbi:MAG: hypothetical protein AB8H79_26405 [Myxococcota bacterium]